MDASTVRGKAAHPTTRTDQRAPSVEKLEQDLELELRHLRTVLREMAANYVSGLESEIERVAEVIGDDERQEEGSVRDRQVNLQGILDRIRTLKVKPEKGRLKDLMRMDGLIGELVTWSEELDWREIQGGGISTKDEPTKHPGGKGVVAIEGSGFGYIVIDGRRYERDVVIRPSGRVSKRKKQLSRKRHGTAHRVSAEELEEVIENRVPSILIVGTGHAGGLSLGDDAVLWLEQRGIPYRALPTPQAIEAFRRAEGRKMAFLHVTC